MYSRRLASSVTGDNKCYGVFTGDITHVTRTKMKAVWALAVLAAIATVDSSVIKAVPRANLNVGYISAGNRLLYRSYVYQQGIPNAIQYQDVTYRGNTTSRITAVQATEVGSTQYATAYIISGGIGWSNVTVRFTSARSWGYYYLLDIWGR